jgi:ferric-dicitrate binding protein FerR (iron transport regulator)
MLYSDEELYALLCKYVLSEADVEERLWVQDWLKANPEHPQLLSSLEKLLVEVPQAAHKANTEQAWQRLNAKIPQPRKHNMWWTVAATLLLAAGIWWIAAHGRAETFRGPLLAQLKDGSSVQLDSGAQLEVSAQLRLVKLKGKALFNVTEDAVHPFIVQLDQQQVKVLGTKFMVDYQDHLRVHVTSGSVMVINGKDTAFLSAGMLLTSGAGVFNVAAHVINADKKELVFSNTPLHEVLQTIEVVYGEKVTADSVLLPILVTATFTGEPAENVLKAITYMTNAVIVQQAGETILKKQEE